jgi:hypothetical protein
MCGRTISPRRNANAQAPCHIGGASDFPRAAADAAQAEAGGADRRNSSYQSVPQLPNPSRDANSVAKMFRDAGFDTVDTLINVGNLEFKRAIRKFETIADQADIAVVYYAGHGLEISGVNYLIPIDARLASDPTPRTRRYRWSGWSLRPMAQSACG